MWPGGVQPVTDAPSFELIRDGHPEAILTCQTGGASIGYKKGIHGDWKIYSAPVAMGKNDTLYARAIRYGYAESEMISVVADESR